MKNDFMVVIGVNNLDASISFYSKLAGFELINRIQINKDTEFAFLLYNNSIELQLICRKGEPIKENCNLNPTLAFKVNDIKIKYQELLNSEFEISPEILEMKSGIKFIQIKDLDGINISFVEE